MTRKSDGLTTNGNATSYFNSSYDQGVVPSPDAPRIADATEQEIAKCANGEKKTNTFLTQNELEEIVIRTLGTENRNVDFRSGKIDYTYIEAERNSATTLKQALQNAKEWPDSFNGKYTMCVVSAGLLATGGAVALSGAKYVTIAGKAVRSTIVANGLIAAGNNGIISGYFNERSGGSFAGGWEGGTVSGAVTGIAIGIALTLNAATLLAKTTVVGLGFFGGTLGNGITQKVDSGNIDIYEAAKAGGINAALASVSAYFGGLFSDPVLSDGIAGTIENIGNLTTSMIYEALFDMSSVALSD